ncbi:hypothetical protein IWW37_005092 [Coemansia sp. RSA 2050]|nr:hypothetical protein IWW37_005092 [Coemansia sp. RSA 2050]
MGIKDGLHLVFTNTLQYKIPELKLTDKKKPGHCKSLTFYFVDPSTRIPSTAIAPPQQQNWYFKVLASEPFCSLPQLVMEGIMSKVDFPISFKEAKKLCQQECEEKANEYSSFNLFESVLF